MTTFDDREKAHEAKYALDQETAFRVTARRNRLLGAWAAERMGLQGPAADAYAKEVVAADFEEAGDEDVIRKVHHDLRSKGVTVTDTDIRTQLAEFYRIAREQILKG